MVSEILKIKTTIPPLSPDIISRSRFWEQLETALTTAEGFARWLTLISAPAGFGKTTLVREWIAGQENRAAWYSIDEGDNEPERFWVYLISALQTLNKNVGSGPLAALNSRGLFSSSSSDPISLLTPLLNELFELSEPVFLVLDDYHLINNPSIHEEMLFFIENLPPSLHLILTTRSDPPWPLSRWRVRGKMREIRMEELKFSREEARKLFAEFSGPLLNEFHLNTLYHKTEGWATGLQLAAYSLSTSKNADDFVESFAGSSRNVFHFLSEEVFNRQPESVQKFLLHTSILNRLNVPLCSAVTGSTDSAEILASLDKKNLFVVPLDDQGNWYRYHHQFSDLLLYTLKRTYPQEVPGLHEKASRWFLEFGEPGEAVHHAMAAGSPEQVVKILHECYEQILQTEGPELLSRIHQKYPLELFNKYPRLVVHKVLNSLIFKGKEEAEALLKLAEELEYTNQKDMDEYEGMLAAIKSYYYIYSNNFPQALENADKALKLLTYQNHYWRMNAAIYSGDARLFSGSPKDAYPFYQEAHRYSQNFDNQYVSLTTGFKVATSLFYLGRLKEAEELTQNLLQIARDQGFSRVPRTGLLWTLLGELLREKGSLEEAERCVERGLFLSNPEKPSLGWNLLFKAALSFSQGEYQKALLTIRQIETIHRESVLPQFIMVPAAVWESRILLELGEPDKAWNVLNDLGISTDGRLHGGQEKGYLVLARLMIEGSDKSGALRKVRELLDCLEEFVSLGGNQGILVETLLVKSLLEEKAGRLEDAEGCLLESLIRGRENGYFQTFLDQIKEQSSVFSRVLKKGQGKNVSPEDRKLQELIQNILNKISPGNILTQENYHTEEKTKLSKFTEIQELVEELSPRELEVLDLISQGLSNQDISKKLFLSPGTVKWHNNNIFGKLGVKSRTQAAALARRLNLIP